MDLKPWARAVSDPEPRRITARAQGLKSMDTDYEVGNWLTRLQNEDIYIVRFQIDTQKEKEKKIETFSFSILCKFINFVFYVNLY